MPYAIHFILTAALGSTCFIFCLKGVRDLNVQIPLVFLIRLIVQEPSDTFIFLNCKDFPNIEHSLLPVGVLGVGSSGKSNFFVAGCEIDIEPRDDRVDEIVAFRGEPEGDGEYEISSGDCI